MRVQPLLQAAFLLSSFVPAALAQGQEPWVYFARGSTISKIRADGSGLAAVRPGSGAPRGLAVDAEGGRIYWGDSQLGTVSSIAFDGSEFRSRALAPGARPVDLAISGTELYWIDGQLGGVWTAPLAGAAAGGAAAPRRLAEAGYPAPNALAVSQGEVFFAARQRNRIQRLSPSGELDEEFLWLDGELGSDLAMDSTRVCWLEDRSLRCGRSKETIQTLIPVNPDAPGGIFALATYGDKELVWAEAEGFYKTPVILRGATAGGDGARELALSREWVSDLAVSADHLYWLDRDGVHRVPLRQNGGQPSPPEMVHAFNWRPITSLQVHRGALYWTEGEGSAARIVRSTLDGGAEQVLVEELGAHSLAIAQDTLYWSVAARNLEQLRAAALDGSNLRTLKQGHVASAGALAASGDRVFQVDRVSDKILRTDPAGQTLEWVKHQPAANQRFFQRALAARPDLPGAVAVVDGRLYWTVWNNEKIARAGLDGSEVEDLLTEREVGGGLTWDPVRRRLYWVESDPWSIWSADLEGGDARRVVERPMPEHLAVSGDWLVWSETDTRGPLVLSSLYRCRIDDCQAEQIVDPDEIGGPGHIFDKRRREVIVPAPTSLVAGPAGTIYWTEHETCRLLSSRVDGSAKRVLLEGLSSMDQISGTGNELYLHRTSRDTIERLALDDAGNLLGEPVLLAEADLATDSLAVSGDWLYFVDQSADSIARLRLRGDPGETVRPENVWSAAGKRGAAAGSGAEEPVSSLPASISSLFVTGERLYWTEHTGSRVMSSRLDGSDVRQIAGDALLANSVVATERALLWSQVQGIFRRPLAGGEPEPIFEGRDVSAIAVER